MNRQTFDTSETTCYIYLKLKILYNKKLAQAISFMEKQF